jgi:hypothetical protein
MKHVLYVSLLAAVATACSTNSPDSDPTAHMATAHTAISQLIQQTAGKDFTYQPVKWAQATPLQAEDMGELVVQQQLALWAKDKQRAGAFYDTIIGAQDLMRKGYPQDALWKAAIVADAVDHRAAERARVVSRLLDSVQHANPKAAPLIAGQRVWHTFQLTTKAGVVQRDSAAFLVLSSGTVLFAYPLAERFWEPDTRDPF